jgi:hypothetical protein
MNITPDNITSLKDDEVFVFGSNVAGRHGKGAAKTAMKWGAKYGQGFGIQGRTFAIPTMNAKISNKLSIAKIEDYVQRFIEYAANHPELKFFVTEIGCGLAGWTPKDIAPLLWGCDKMTNVYLPQKFWRVLQHKSEPLKESDIYFDGEDGF